MTPDASTLGLFVMSAVFVSKWLWDYRREMRDRDRAFEPRHDPVLHKAYVGREEYDRDQADNNKRHDGAKESREKMHLELKAVSNDVASLKADNNSQTRELHQLRQSIEAMPERIVKILDRRSQ